jgi:quinol monooxygenase YgiN
MYGTIMRAQAKPGRRDEFIAEMKRRGTAQDNPGFISAEIAYEDKDSDRVIGIIHFRDRESYLANAQRPQTDEQYKATLDYLVGPPEWIDVHYVAYRGEPISEDALAASR